MLLRLTSIVVMVALLLGSSVPALLQSGPLQPGCLVITRFASEAVLQLCPPAAVGANNPHGHEQAPHGVQPVQQAVLSQSPIYLPLILRPAVPFPTAPLCPDSGTAHAHSQFHTLWDQWRGCHYDHEHGANPFTPEVAGAFPGFDLPTLLGQVGIGHTNPSSAMENTHKHGGFKWNVQLLHPENCAGFEGATVGVNGSVIQYHGFGDYAVELEGRVHSVAALFRQCLSSNPNDFGYVYLVQHVDYGQRVVPYQGTVFPYPDTPSPSFNGGLGPYLSVDCIDAVVPQCRDSRDQVLRHNLDAASYWTSKGSQRIVPSGSPLFSLLWRVRDIYRLFEWNDQTYPFTFTWLCSADGGATYNPAACRYNNTTTQVHEIAGEIPAAWDNLAGFDSDTRVGRITGQGYVTRFGTLNPACTAPAPDCHPIKMANAFVGTYGSVLVYFGPNKDRNIIPLLPERDIFFCGERICGEDSPGALASGWVGPHN
jgi:hypothetical protein